MTPIHKTLIDIQESQTFERLETFKDSKIWNQMTDGERNLFALLLLRQGAQLLEKGDGKVLDNFALAEKVASQAPSIYLQQGLIFAAQTENSRCLNLACQAFSKAVEGNPNLFEAWYQWARTLISQGVLHNESHYFIESHQKFEKAALLLPEILQETNIEEFYWKWADGLALLGKHSGEPVDYYNAINQYRIAYDLGCQETAFYCDYGCALSDLASLLDHKEMSLDALKLFDKGLQQDPSYFKGWFKQACCLLRLVEMTFEEEFFLQANSCFETAIFLNPLNDHVWMLWGRLEASYGKMKRSQKLLDSSLQKFAKAYEIDPDFAPTLSFWAETELYIGTHQDRFELIQNAQARIIKSLKLDSENLDSWYIYGACLNECGHYFEQQDYYHQAIEKFNYGLKLSNQNPLLWYGLALSYFSLGELNEDLSSFEQSVRYCSRVTECGGELFPQFWNDWGVALMKLAEMTDQSSYADLAIEKFERAFKIPGDSDYEDVDLEWVYNYGCAFDLLGDLTEDPRHFEKAIAILSQVIALDSTYIHARYNLALAYSHLGEISLDVDHYWKAIDQFQSLLELDPEDEIVHMDYGVSLANLALLIQEDHEREKSDALFRQAELQLMQSASLGNCQAHYQLAGLYSLTDNYSLAMYYLEKAYTSGGLPSLEDIMHDDWLDGLRDTTPFRHFLNQLSSRPEKEES